MLYPHGSYFHIAETLKLASLLAIALLCVCKRWRFHSVKDLCFEPFPSNIFQGKICILYEPGSKTSYIWVILKVWSCIKRSPPFFFKIWCLQWKAARVFIYCTLRNSFSQMEGHKNDGLLSCSLKFALWTHEILILNQAVPGFLHMNPSKFLTSVLLLFHFRQNSSGGVRIGGGWEDISERQTEVVLSCLCILVDLKN